ncbi:hypothetical protein [Candidatus Nitronereus thalassa]|uniref:Uncharacterized protein n=1 Tax=Candidatus Nitronereus thalassa TaxID=3020898 RepID=A0ABU3K8L7_9BACT|nr:hypothetical protein [Candidatus Nitronereus thalassa]MDT7042736.1 hypothetical protein [Candidatus Nitronereus thalassa]
MVVWGDRFHFGRLLIVPVGLWVLIHLLETYLIGVVEDTWVQIGLSFIAIIPASIIFTIFAIPCHRSILIGKHVVPQFGFGGWAMRETQFLLRFTGIYIIGLLMMFSPILVLAMGGSAFVPPQISGPFFGSWLLLMVIAFFPIVGRLSLILPSIALNLDQDFSSVWALSIGNGWRLGILVAGIPVAFLFLPTIIGDLSMEKFGFGATIIYEIAHCFLILIEVAILSISYQKLVKWKVGAAS